MSCLGAVDVVATTLPMPPFGALVAALVAVVPVVFLAVVPDVDFTVVRDVPDTAAVVVVAPISLVVVDGPVSPPVVAVFSMAVDVVEFVAVDFLPPPPHAASTMPSEAATARTLLMRTTLRRG